MNAYPHRRSERSSVEFDEIAYCIDSGLICGYIQFRAGCLREVWDWVREYGSLWLIDRYSPVYFETTLLIVGHHTIKAWQAMIHAAVKYISLSVVFIRMLTCSKAAHLFRLKCSLTLF